MAIRLLLLGPALLPAAVVRGNLVEFTTDRTATVLSDSSSSSSEVPAENVLTGCKAETPRNRLTNGDEVSPARSLTPGATCELQGEAGVNTPQDCEFCRLTNADSTTCAEWNNKEGGASLKGQWTPVIISYVIGMVMAYAIGGNDSANSLATTVGSGALDLTKAVWMGAVGEFLGATFLGAGVSSTIQRGVADLNDPQCWACGFCNSEMDKYQGGMLAALFGAAFFLLLVTFWSLPVSTTHAVVGGVVGITWAAVGFGCLNFSLSDGLGRIAAGWVVSPLVAGAIGSLCYYLTYALIMKAKDPKQAGLFSLPVLYGLTFTMMTFLTMQKAPLFKPIFKSYGWEGSELLLYLALISSVVGLLFAVGAHFLVVPAMRTEVAEVEAQWANPETGGASFASSQSKAQDSMRRYSQISTRSNNILADNSKEVENTGIELKVHDANEVSDEGQGLVIFTTSPPTKSQLLAKRVFKNLLVMTAFIKCVGHGANDTANATGIVGAVQFVFEDGIHACQSRDTETWIMAAAGFMVGVGVVTMGYRVIKAVGEDLADMDFHVGFCVEFSSACAVVIATIMGLPVSTTHCQIGAIVFVAATAQGRDSVAWGMFGKIAVTWVATLPAAGGVAYILTALRYGF